MSTHPIHDTGLLPQAHISSLDTRELSRISPVRENRSQGRSRWLGFCASCHRPPRLFGCVECGGQAQKQTVTSVTYLASSADPRTMLDCSKLFPSKRRERRRHQASQRTPK
eukprot:scaffold1455_cov65-Phaeocystis_antarctica.AAC.4